MTSKNGLTHEELEVACRNIGFDLTCGSCACLFFTGTTVYAHDAGCKTPRGVSDVVMTSGATPMSAKHQLAAEAVRKMEAPDALVCVERGHLMALRLMAKRFTDRASVVLDLGEDRMGADEMRAAAQAIMVVVRFAESLEALRGPGEPYVHMTPRQENDPFPQHRDRVLGSKGHCPTCGAKPGESCRSAR